MGEIAEFRGAGEGNRTLVISLEGFCSTIELHPPDSTFHPNLYLHFRPAFRPMSQPAFSLAGARNWWRGLDSNQRRRKANRFTVCPLQPLGHPSGGTGNYIAFSAAWVT